MHISQKRRQMLAAALSTGAASPALAALSGQAAQGGHPESLHKDLPHAYAAASVGFSQLGPGALATSVSAQLNKSIYSSDYQTIQQAHDAVVAMGGGTLWVSGHHKIDKPFRWDYNKVLISGSHGIGSTLDFSNLRATGDGEKFAFIMAHQAASKGRKTIQSVTIIGPPAKFGISCFPLDSAVDNAITNINFIGVTIIDFQTQLYFGSQCSNIYFNMCQFTNSDGEQFRTATVIKTPEAGINNSGENWCFTQCQFNNIDKVIENNNGIAGGWSFNQCSLVYFNTLFDLRAPCKVTVGSGSRIESDAYGSHWISVKGNGCLVRINQSEFWFAGKIVKEIFRSDPDTVFGGIYLRDCDYHADIIQIRYWVDQTAMGPVMIENWRSQDGIARIPFGRNPGVQQEAWPHSHPNFEKTLLVLPGDASTCQMVAGRLRTESATRIATRLAGQEILRYKRYPIRPGQNIEGSVWVKATGFAEDGSSFGVHVTIIDAQGLILGSGNPFSSKGNTDYICVSLSWYPLAPAGAAFYELKLLTTASVRNVERSIFLADLVINTY